MPTKTLTEFGHLSEKFYATLQEETARPLHNNTTKVHKH